MIERVVLCRRRTVVTAVCADLGVRAITLRQAKSSAAQHCDFAYSRSKRLCNAGPQSTNQAVANVSTIQRGKHFGLDFWLNEEPLHNETGNYSTSLFTERARHIITTRDVDKVSPIPMASYNATRCYHIVGDIMALPRCHYALRGNISIYQVHLLRLCLFRRLLSKSSRTAVPEPIEKNVYSRIAVSLAFPCTKSGFPQNIEPLDTTWSHRPVSDQYHLIT